MVILSVEYSVYKDFYRKIVHLILQVNSTVLIFAIMNYDLLGAFYVGAVVVGMLAALVFFCCYSSLYLLSS